MNRQLYIPGFLSLVAGGFLYILSYTPIGTQWSYWGEFMFFVGLFLSVSGVVIPEKKTKTMTSALSISFFATFVLTLIWIVIQTFFLYGRALPVTLTPTTQAFLCMIIATASYLILDRYVYTLE